MESKVAVLGILRFPPDSVENILPHLKIFVDATKANDDCIMYEVAEDPFDKGLFRFSELWPSRDSLEAHLVAKHIGPWREQARKYGLLERVFDSYDISSSSVPV